MNPTIARLTAALEGRYRLDRELGQGGMATVYLAHDIKHDRDSAINVLHPDLGAALGGERFLTETRTTAPPRARSIRTSCHDSTGASRVAALGAVTYRQLRGRLPS